MKCLIDIKQVLINEDYERRQLSEKLLKEMDEIDESIAALTERKKELFAERQRLFAERSVLYETIQAFEKQFNAEGL